MNLDREGVEQIVRLVADSAIEEFQLELGDFKLRLRKQRGPGIATPAAERVEVGAGWATAVAPSAVLPGAEPVSPEAELPGLGGRKASAPAVPEGLVAVTAPLLGTFYRAPAPGAPPFVEVGSLVEEGDMICIIEVMKLMNEVPAPCKGRVVEIYAENASLVEYGQTLIVIDPRV